MTRDEASSLVASIEAAIATHTGDIRSNAVIAKLVIIAKLWIAEGQQDVPRSATADHRHLRAG
jgi:hypothetical protein